MKTTIDLPGDLVREVKLRAVHDGRKLKDEIADLLRRGLVAASMSGGADKARKGRLKLPLFPCSAKAPARKMSAAALNALAHETLNREDCERLGLSF